jgi:hypothetical protein
MLTTKVISFKAKTAYHLSKKARQGYNFVADIIKGMSTILRNNAGIEQ